MPPCYLDRNLPGPPSASHPGNFSGPRQASSSHPELSSAGRSLSDGEGLATGSYIMSPLRTPNTEQVSCCTEALALSQYPQKLCWWPRPASAKLLLSV